MGVGELERGREGGGRRGRGWEVFEGIGVENEKGNEGRKEDFREEAIIGEKGRRKKNGSYG